MTSPSSFVDWISAMPKAELHLHIDGSLQAFRLLKLAEKHQVALPYNTIEEVEAAYDFKDLQSFLDLYYLGASVLREEEDFYHLMWDYLLKCREQNIIHCEIMVEPQSYLPNGVRLEAMMAGFNQAIHDAEEAWGQSVLLILDFLRHLPEEDCLALLEQVNRAYSHEFIAIGLASSEKGSPPGNFTGLYERARNLGYRATAHAGEEGPADYVRDSLDQLKVERIDHGVRSVEDPELMKRLAREGIPLTVCPLSNVRLKVVDSLKEHNILELMEQGLTVTVNSDDPAYFGGFLNENFIALHEELGLTPEQVIMLNRQAFESSFLPEKLKRQYLATLDRFLEAQPVPAQ